MAAPILFPDDPNLQTKTVLADNDIFLIGSPANGNLVRRTTLASIKDSIDIPMATTEADGLMSSEDKTKLLGLSSYTHPATHSLDMITETETLKVMTAEEREKLSSFVGGGGNYIGLFDDAEDMFSSGAVVGQYGYYELDGYRFPIFCVDEDITLTSSWFAVGGGGSVSVATEAPIITSSPMQVARTPVLYRYQIEATNSPIVYSVTGLPTGLTCNPYTGLISGYATSAEGVYPCIAYASNLVGTGSSAFSITISNIYMVEGHGIDYAFALKKLSVDATYALEVTNGAGVAADIGFDPVGNLDVGALLAHCGAGNGYVSKWYNQGLYKSTLGNLQQDNPTNRPIIVSSGSVIRKAGEIAIFDHRYSEPSSGCWLELRSGAGARLIIFRYAFENVNDGAGVITTYQSNWGFSGGDKIRLHLRELHVDITTAALYCDADQIGVTSVTTEYDKDKNMHTYGVGQPNPPITLHGVGGSPYKPIGLKGYINCVLGSATLSSAYHYTQIYNELNQ